MSEQVQQLPELQERDMTTSELLEAVRLATKIPRSAIGLVGIEESTSYGTKSRSVELNDGSLYIRAHSFVGADPDFDYPGANRENLSVLAEIWGMGKMSCDIRNRRVEEVSYIDAKDPSRAWRNEHTPECEAEALALLELALEMVKTSD